MSLADHLNIRIITIANDSAFLTKADLEIDFNKDADGLLGADVFAVKQDGKKVFNNTGVSRGDLKRAFSESQVNIKLEMATRTNFRSTASMFNNTVCCFTMCVFPLQFWFSALDNYAHCEIGLMDWLVQKNLEAVQAAETYFEEGFS